MNLSRKFQLNLEQKNIQRTHAKINLTITTVINWNFWLFFLRNSRANPRHCQRQETEIAIFPLTFLKFCPNLPTFPTVYES